jgi:hypothetical protein
MKLVHKFEFIDRHGWNKEEILSEALVVANRRGELLEFWAQKVEVLESVSTRDGEVYTILIFGKYTNEYLA